MPENVPAIEPEYAEHIVIPSATTPCARSRATGVESRSATLPANAVVPFCCLKPLVPIESLKPIGMPHSHGAAWPRRPDQRRLSAARASASAPASSMRTNAL